LSKYFQQLEEVWRGAAEKTGRFRFFLFSAGVCAWEEGTPADSDQVKMMASAQGQTV